MRLSMICISFIILSIIDNNLNNNNVFKSSKTKQ